MRYNRIISYGRGTLPQLIDFPNEIPFQTATNEIKADIIFQPFETAREYHVNDKRYFR